MHSIGKHIQSFPPQNRWIFESKRPPETPRLPWKHESSRSVCFWSHPGGLIHPRWCRISSTNSSCELKNTETRNYDFGCIGACWTILLMYFCVPSVFCTKSSFFLGGRGSLRPLGWSKPPTLTLRTNSHLSTIKSTGKKTAFNLSANTYQYRYVKITLQITYKLANMYKF